MIAEISFFGYTIGGIVGKSTFAYLEDLNHTKSYGKGGDDYGNKHF